MRSRFAPQFSQDSAWLKHQVGCSRAKCLQPRCPISRNYEPDAIAISAFIRAVEGSPARPAYSPSSSRNGLAEDTMFTSVCYESLSKDCMANAFWAVRGVHYATQLSVTAVRNGCVDKSVDPSCVSQGLRPPRAVTSPCALAIIRFRKCISLSRA